MKQPILKVNMPNLKYQRRDHAEESKTTVENEEMKKIQILLFDLAKHGELLVLKENFINQMKEWYDYT